MTQDEQIYRQDRWMAAAGVATGVLSALLGIAILLRDGLTPPFIAAVTGGATAVCLARRYRTLTAKIKSEQRESRQD